jgi:hypothetical protein
VSEELARHGELHQFVALSDRGHQFDGDGLEDPLISWLFDQLLAFPERQGT